MERNNRKVQYLATFCGERICVPHICSCGSNVDQLGHHGLSCPKSAGRRFRHGSVNNVIHPALVTAGIPSVLEPSGISRSDGKRPDGLNLVPWSMGRALVWDATWSHLQGTSARAVDAADLAEKAKSRKYESISNDYVFVPFGLETMGPWGPSAKKFFKELSKRLVNTVCDKRADSFLAQQISIAVQRGNAASVLGTLPQEQIMVALASLCVGASSTWPSPVLPKLSNNETDVTITDHEIAWLMAINSPGFMLGSLISGTTADRLGRRATILVSVIPFGLGTSIVLLAIQPWLLFITRFLWGCGTGMVGMVVTMYVGEIADKDIRGSLMLITKVFFNLGSLIIMSLGPFVSYRVINTFLFILPGCYFVSCWFIPESPYVFLKDGKMDSAKKALKKLKGFNDQIILEEKLTELKLQIQDDMKRPTSTREFITGKAYRKAIIIAAVLKTVQIMMGAVTITQYLGKIMQESGAEISIRTVLMIFGAVKFVIGLTSTILVDRIGRRTLLIYGCVGYGLSLSLVGCFFYFKEIIEVDSNTLKPFGYIPFLGIIASSVISILAIDCVIFIIPGEIFATNIKSVALTCLNLYSGVLGFLVAHFYQFIKDFSGLTGVFFVFATVTYVGSVFVKFSLPETKGKSLHDIAKELQGLDNDESGKLNDFNNVESGKLNKFNNVESGKLNNWEEENLTPLKNENTQL